MRTRVLKQACPQIAKHFVLTGHRVCYLQLRPAGNKSICWAHSIGLCAQQKASDFTHGTLACQELLEFLGNRIYLLVSYSSLFSQLIQKNIEIHFKIWAYLFSPGL